jgi:hypothetical protein
VVSHPRRASGKSIRKLATEPALNPGERDERLMSSTLILSAGPPKYGMRTWINLIEQTSSVNPYDDSVWYRGTNHPGTHQIGNGQNGDMLGRGFYLTNDRSYAEKFGDHVEEFQVMLGSVLLESDAPHPMSGDQLNAYARSKGFDAILARVGPHTHQLCVFDLRLVNPVEDE